MEENTNSRDDESQEIDMHSKGISDISPVISVVNDNPQVGRLNLSDNNITQLPRDLSGLKEVYEINLIDNDLEPFEDAILALSSAPKLESLHLNLHEEAQVDFVIRNLPHLKYLNGEAIDRNELNSETGQDEASERGDQQYDELPKEIIEVEEEEPTIEQHETKEEVKQRSDNDHNTSFADSCYGTLSSDSEEVSLKPRDLETIALIFDKIRNMHRKNKLSSDKQMASDFDKHLKSCMQKLSSIVTDDNISNHKKNSAVLKTKFDLGEICHDKALQYLEKKDKNISKVYSKTYQIHSEIISDYERLYSTLADKYAKKKQGNTDLEKEVEKLNADLEKAKKDREAVLEVGENIEKQMQTKLQESNQQQEEYKKELEELKEKLKEAENENATLLEKIVKHTKDRSDRVLSVSPLRSESASKQPSKPTSRPHSHKQSQKQIEPLAQIDKPIEDRRSTLELLNMPGAKKGELIGHTNVRIVTLKQLKDIINDIYLHKEKHDENCRRNHLPLETMEQFMFTYLNQRYGLKNLIIEWAASIVNGVKCYMKEDCDVALFAKLLKNEIEEDFRYIQEKIKNTVSKVLKKHLREKHKLKGENDINTMQEQLEDSYISNQACTYILDYIYESADKQQITNMLHQRKSLSINKENLYTTRGRNTTPPRYAFTKTTHRTKDLTPRGKSRTKVKVFGEEDTNERQEELYNKLMMEKDYNKVAFKDLVYCI